MTEAGLCNLALLRVGQRLTISALTDQSPEAKACRTAFDNARRVVLEEHPWSWATRRSALALVSGAERTGWTYVYAVPSDMVTPIELCSGYTNPTRDQGVPYAIEDGNADTPGSILLTNLEDAELRYVSDEVSVARYPQKVADAMAWLMVPDLAAGLSVKPHLVPNMVRFALGRIAQAAAADVNRQLPEMEQDSEFVRGR